MRKCILAVSALCLSAHTFAQNTWTPTNATTTNGNLTVGGTATVTGVTTLNGGLNLYGGANISNTVTIGDGRLHMRSTPYTLPIPNYKIYVENSNLTESPNGFYNYLSNTVTGTQYAYQFTSEFNGTSGTKYGIYHNFYSASSSTSYGAYLLTGGSGNGQRYGIYNRVVAAGTGTKYGIYTQVFDNGLSETRYGIYSDARGTNAKAGYFYGDLENNGNFLMTGNNQNRTIFQNFTSGLAIPLADQYVSFMSNTTSGLTDWNTGNALKFFNSGLIEKNTTLTTKVLSIRRSDLAKDVFRVLGDGKVFATEVNVMLYTAFPDYVFQPEYKLMSLKEVDSYIQENGHLPNVPDAATVAEEGINLGDMTKTLVEKVEELTLYMIEQQKVIEQQQAQIDALKAQVQPNK
jgi:trimeric autotransporter adhesin